MINKILPYWFGIHKKLRYLLVGGYNTVFAYGLFVILEIALRNYINYIFVLIIAHFLSVFNSFITFRIFVFRSVSHFWREFAKVNLVYLFYLTLNIVTLYFLNTIIGVNLFAAQVICIVILTLLFYYVHEHFSFKI